MIPTVRALIALGRRGEFYGALIVTGITHTGMFSAIPPIAKFAAMGLQFQQFFVKLLSHTFTSL